MTLDAQTPQNSPAPEADVSTQPAAPSAAASPTSPIEKPSWLPDDTLFDAEKGVKFDELGARFKELAEKQTEAERISAERKAATPEKADDYGISFPEGFEAPKDFAIDEKSPMWKTLQEAALSRGMTKAEYAETAAKMVSSLAEQQRNQVKALTEYRDNLFKEKLGDNFAEKVESVNKGLTALFGEQLGKVLAASHFTPEIVTAHEKMLDALSRQGVTTFTSTGRDGEPSQYGEDFSKQSFKQQWANAR